MNALRLRNERASFLLFVCAANAAELALSRARVLQGVAGLVGAPLLGSEIYARLPPVWAPSSLPPLSVPKETDELILILPGAGGPDANTKRIVAALSSSSSNVVAEYDWQPFCGDTLRAPYNAQRVGEHIGRELGRLAELRRVHLVGVSVGAFVADRAVDSYARSGGTSRAATRLTLLDPFTARGLPGLARPATAYGIARFGRAADEAVALINTDDPVPSTSLPLRHCRNLDVTAAAARESFVPLPGDSLHSWPCAWFGLNRGVLPREAERVARGGVFRVP